MTAQDLPPPDVEPRPTGWRWYHTALVAVVVVALLPLGLPMEGHSLPKAVWLAWNLLCSHGLAVAAIVAAVYGEGGWRGIPARLGLRRLGEPEWRLVLRTTAVAVVGSWVVTALTVWAVTALGQTPSHNPLVEWLFGDGPRMVAVIVIGAVVVAPLAEEAVFRVVVYRVLAERLTPGVATVLTALLFALLHGIPEQLPGLTMLGVILQWAYGRTGNFWVAVAIHAGFNSVTVLATLLFRAHGAG
jgi:membrane protease YdiL (CAAX protease family)